jgi:hypothetical protein
MTFLVLFLSAVCCFGQSNKNVDFLKVNANIEISFEQKKNHWKRYNGF